MNALNCQGKFFFGISFEEVQEAKRGNLYITSGQPDGNEEVTSSLFLDREQFRCLMQFMIAKKPGQLNEYFRIRMGDLLFVRFAALKP